jgi:hypothetical protein
MIEAIEREVGKGIGQIIIVIVSVPPFAVGWLFGFAARTLTWTVAAVIAGYKAGRGS